MEEALKPPSPAKRLAIIEVLDRDGSVKQAWPVYHWPMTLGRSLDCDIVLDDPCTAAQHARIESSSDGLRLEALPSINGLLMGHQSMASGTTTLLVSGNEWQMGQSHLRLRCADAELTPESPLPRKTGITGPRLLLVWFASFMFYVFEAYAGSDPDNFWQRLLPLCLGFGVVVTLWTSAWALVTRLFQKQMTYKQHLWIAGLGLLIANVLELVLSLSAYASSIESLGRFSTLIFIALLSTLVWQHGLLVQPRRPRAMKWVGMSVFCLSFAAFMLPKWIATGRLSSQLYMTSLYPPSLRLASSQDAESFLKEANNLRATLDAAAKSSVSALPAFDFNDD